MNGDNILQSSSPVQQLVAAGGNFNRRWSQMTTTTPPPANHQSSPPPHFFLPQNEPPPSMHSSWHHDDHNNQEFQDSSLSQLLMSGILVGDEEDHKLALTQMQKVKKLENWEEQLLHHDNDDDHLHGQISSSGDSISMVVKQEAFLERYGYGEDHNDELVGGVKQRNWSDHQMIQLSSCPNSCVMISSRNKADGRSADHRASESNSTSGNGGASKKAKVEPPSSTQSTFKVKKEKLGDRITALHQMVSPFGKTDTASVLLEVMGYIKFLEAQIQALSLPYFGVQLTNMTHHHHSDCDEEPRTDLKSVGLCLVPVSCTMQVGSDNGTDYWALVNNFRL